MHQGKDVIGEAGRVGVVLLDPQVGLVVQQAVEHIGGIADADIHHAGAERRVLVGDGYRTAVPARYRTSG